MFPAENVIDERSSLRPQHDQQMIIDGKRTQKAAVRVSESGFFESRSRGERVSVVRALVDWGRQIDSSGLSFGSQLCRVRSKCSGVSVA